MQDKSSFHKFNLRTKTMSALTHSPTWLALEKHQKEISRESMREMFRADPQRFGKFSLELEGLFLDFSKNILNQTTLDLLFNLAQQSKLDQAIQRLFSSEKVNISESRAALHTALRATEGSGISLDGKNIDADIKKVLNQMRTFVEQVRNETLTGYTGKPFRDIVNIGIGGSSLGPMMVTHALRPYSNGQLNVHFVSNVDATDLIERIKPLNPETTLFIVSSKTFKTQETIINAQSAREWLVHYLGSEQAVSKHFVAISANPQEAMKFGIPQQHVFEFWDWVGGRFSVWSSIGLSIALFLGMAHFEALLDGGHAMDEHFRNAPLEKNMPVILGLLAIWYINFFQAGSYAVLPYDQYLRYFPLYLQQLEMESNGKRIDRDGHVVDYTTQVPLWGEAGTNGQHSFYQLIHQGTHLIPADLLVPANSHNPIGHHHAMLLAHCFAQSEALMLGKTEEEVRLELSAQGFSGATLEALLPYKVFPGNRPSNTLMFDKLDPYTLGMLIALYEHKVYVQSVIWNINPFDQWGVELGKQLADRLLPELLGNQAATAHDSSTNGLINHYRKHRHN